VSELITLGVSYKTAPVELRERLSLSERRIPEALAELHAHPSVQEAVVISTCNRMEVSVVVDEPVAAETAVIGLLTQMGDLRPTELAEVMYAPRNCDAARHLFRVTSGLESMVIGEAEVQGQVKRAYEHALAAGTTGPLTNRLFTAALQTGKRVRTETSIGAGRASVASVAVALAEDALGELRERHVVIIGAGDTSELVARALHERGVATLLVANRRADRARSLAERFGGSVASFDELPALLVSADIVLASTSSPHPIVGVEELELVMAERNGRPLLLVDIAVPRDIDPACGSLEGVVLRDIDDLEAVVRRTTHGRESESGRAEEIVESEIMRFAEWLGTLAVRPTIAALREHATEIVDQVLSENAGRWETASERDLARVEAIARAVTNRILHEPTLRLRTLAEQQRHGRLQLARELFGLDEGAVVDAPESAVPADVRQLRPG
jgi:glutamyl-tRNA reductase